MEPTDAAALRGEGKPVDVDERSLDEIKVTGAADRPPGHEHCVILPLDLTDDPDARAAAALYAARVTHRRPRLSRELRALADPLRPGERYVTDPEAVDLDAAGRALRDRG